MRYRYSFIVFILIIIMVVGFLYIKGTFYNSPPNIYNPVLKRLADDINSDWGLAAIKIPDLTKVLKLRKVTICVIDSGCNINTDRILPGYNAIDKSNNILDDTGHGTEVTSVITKVFPSAYILPIKIIDKTTGQKSTILAEAIRWSIKNKADVINISLGMETDDECVKSEINNAIKLNIPVICSAGNNGNSNKLLFPANMNNVISVVSRDINNIDVGFSNKSEKKSFSAPGVNIKTINNKFVSGTSIATPFVSGIVGIAKGLNHDIQLKTLLEIMQKTSVDGNYFSYGLIQADKIISEIQKTTNTSNNYIN